MITGLPRMAAVGMFVWLLAVATDAQVNPAPTDATGAASTVESDPSVLDDPWSAVEPELSKPEDQLLARRSTDGGSPILAKKGDTARRPWTRTLGALAGVVGLIVFLAWGYRAMAGGNLPLVGKARRPGMIEVISRTQLSARQSMCLVRIGPRLVLVGQSQDNLRALDVIDDAELSAKLAGEAAGGKPGSSRAEFQACLEREAGDYQSRDDLADENVIPEARRIADVRQTVTDTLQRVRRAVAQV